MVWELLDGYIGLCCVFVCVVWVCIYIYMCCVTCFPFASIVCRCFGFVWKPNERTGYMCALFGELEPSQPVAAIVHFVNKLLANYKS